MSIDDILALPIYKVKGAVWISYTHISLKRDVLLPKLIVLSFKGIISVLIIPPTIPTFVNKLFDVSYDIIFVNTLRILPELSFIIVNSCLT